VVCCFTRDCQNQEADEKCGLKREDAKEDRDFLDYSTFHLEAKSLGADSGMAFFMPKREL
jgi:hypothetical protein